MRKIISMLLVFALSLCFTITTYAENLEDEDIKEQKPAATLCIDNRNVYEGMTRAYNSGYQPSCENGKVILVLPLICDGKMKQDTITASVDLGNTENSPFVFLNYEKDFTYNPELGVYLISFSLELNNNRINGIYPIIVNVSGMDENGEEVIKSFTNYVTITDGIDPNASDQDSMADNAASTEEPPTSAPIVLISKSVINTDTVKAGEDFEVVVTCKNTSKIKSVQNMVATVNVPSADFELKNDSNSIFVGKMGTEKTTDITLKFHVSKSTVEGNYPIEIAMSYDDSKANTFSSAGTFVVTVEQSLDVKLTMPKIEKQMTVGDTIPMSFQVMNLGRSSVYNVRCDVICNGLSQTKTAFIGNMESGTASEGETNVFITPMEGENQYGDTSGKVTLTYEDGFGNEHSQDFTFDTSIIKMPEASTNTQIEENESASQWWISISIIIGIIIIIGATVSAYYIGRKKR